MTRVQTSAQALREARLRLGETQAQFASRCGISRGALAKAEKGRQSLSMSATWAIAERLGVPPSDLVIVTHAAPSSDPSTSRAGAA